LAELLFAIAKIGSAGMAAGNEFTEVIKMGDEVGELICPIHLVTLVHLVNITLNIGKRG
jgi:hypothetical protein